MREILFRGKRKDNGEWVYGSLHTEYGEATKDGNRNIDYRILGMRGECSYVDPETVGQFTGLTANGTKIFEGDIVRCEFAIEPPLICQVVFQFFSFSMYHKRFFGENKIYTPFEQVKRASTEVIGNIHDNPELMEVQK